MARARVRSLLSALRPYPFEVVALGAALLTLAFLRLRGLHYVWNTVEFLFPPLLQVAVTAGIDPVHFATFAVLNLMIGLTTPPVGVCLFVCANMAREPLSKVVKAIVPFLVCNLIVLALVSYIPSLSSWLPKLAFGN